MRSGGAGRPAEWKNTSSGGLGGVLNGPMSESAAPLRKNPVLDFRSLEALGVVKCEVWRVGRGVKWPYE